MPVDFARRFPTGPARTGRSKDVCWRVFVCALILLALTLPSHAAQRAWLVFRVDSVQVFAAEEDRKNAEKVVRHLTLDGLPIADELGTHRLPRVNIYLASSPKVFRELTGTALPDWAGAVAIPEARRIVLKSPHWDRDTNLVETLLHELTHVIVAEVVGNKHVPAWLNEGLAMVYSGRPVYKDGRLIGRALTTRSLIPLSDIDRVLRFRRAKAALAYQESLEAVTYLIQRYGPGAPADILMGLAEGLPFSTAFERAIGRPFRLFELDLIQYWRKTHRWDLLQDLAWIGWVFLVLLAVLAYVLIRRRNARRLAEWDAEAQPTTNGVWLVTTVSAEPGLLDDTQASAEEDEKDPERREP